MADNDFIGIDIQGIPELKEKLAKLPPAAADAGVEAVSDYLISVLRANAPYKYVSRKAAYGTPFFSDKQRRWFFWALNKGEIQIPYKRTQGLSRGWKKIGSGAKQIVVNETRAAPFVRGAFPGEQSRHENMVGWIPMNVEIKNRMTEIVRRFSAAVARVIRKLKL